MYYDNTLKYHKMPSVTLYSARILGHLNRNTKLYKECVLSDASIERLPSYIVCEKKKMKHIEQMRLSEEALRCTRLFINVLKKVPYVDFTNFYQSLKPSFIIEIDDTRHNSGSPHYNILDEKIRIYFDQIIESIFHELLHKLVRRRFDNLIFAGFSQFKIKDESVDNSIGDGIDEIYTSLLTRRYFERFGACGGYDEFFCLGHYFEVIIGREAMERCYFRSDLYSMVEKLAIYSDKNQAISLIRKIDHIYYAMYVNSKPCKSDEYNFLNIYEQFCAKNTFLEIIEIISQMLRAKILKMEREGYSSKCIQQCKNDLISLSEIAMEAHSKVRIPIIKNIVEVPRRYVLTRKEKYLLNRL